MRKCFWKNVTITLSCGSDGLKKTTITTRLPMQDTWVHFLGQEDPLKKEMATPSSILAWRIPWTEAPEDLQSTGVGRSCTQLRASNT